MRELPSLKNLRAFEAAAKTSSIRKAAEILFITPAAISKQIKSLELFLGCDLFTRHQWGLELTEKGEIYLYHVQRSLAELRKGTKNVIRTKERTIIKLRSYSTFSVNWLIPRIADFYASYPDIVIDIATTSRWIDFNVDGVDAAVRLGSGNWPGMQSFRLVDNVIAPVCSPHIAKLLSSIDDLRHYTLLHVQARPDDWDKWLSEFGPSDMDSYSGQKYESSILAYQAAIQSQGISMGQLDLITTELAKGNLVLPFDKTLDLGKYTYYLVRPESGQNKPELDIFCNWISSYN